MGGGHGFPPDRAAAHPLFLCSFLTGLGGPVTTYQNPVNVPTGGNATYAALAPITSKQLRMLGWLKRTVGDSPTWESDCRRILGADWDGDFTSLSQAAGSWLIFVLQRGLVEVAGSDVDLTVAPR